jgi:acetyl-CoA decarbonylase/synthase complex subunit alpha
LFQTVETPQEAMVTIAKLCIRPNDTWKGRSIKLSHYVDLHKRLYGTMPQDLHLFVRTMADVPMTLKDEFAQILEAKGWKETVIPDPTLLPRMIRKMKE